MEGKISVVNQLGRAYNGLVISSALQNDKPLRKTGYDFFACTMTGNQRSGAQNRYGLAALCKRVNARDVPRFTGTYSYTGDRQLALVARDILKLVFGEGSFELSRSAPRAQTLD